MIIIDEKGLHPEHSSGCECPVCTIIRDESSYDPDHTTSFFVDNNVKYTLIHIFYNRTANKWWALYEYSQFIDSREDSHRATCTLDEWNDVAKAALDQSENK